MLNVLKKLCLIVMVVLLFGLTPMLNATSFFQEVGIDQYGKIVETDKRESIAYMGDKFSSLIEYENDEAFISPFALFVSDVGTSSI